MALRLMLDRRRAERELRRSLFGRAPLLFFGLWACSTTPVVTHAIVPLAPGGAIRFGICGDMRSDQGPIVDGQLTEQGRLFAALSKAGFAFVLNTGDLVTRGEDPRDWAIFDELTRGLAEAKTPYVPVIGNHEYLGKNAAALEHYFRRFPELGKEKWHVVRAPPLWVIVLDSNFDQLSPGERSRQRSFLEKSLLAAQRDPAVRLVALAFHHPPYTNGPHRPATEVLGELVLPSRSYSKLRWVISGHVHSYERFERDGLTYVVTGGCGAPPYPVETDARAWRVAPAYLGPAERGYHYLACEIGEARLTCDVMTLSGSTFEATDHFEVEAPAAPRTIEGYDD